MKACSAGEAVTAETRPVEQTIYSLLSEEFLESSRLRTAGVAVCWKDRTRNCKPWTTEFCRPLMFQGGVSAPSLRYRRYLHRAHVTHTASPPPYPAAVGAGRPRPRHGRCARGK